ncbi:MAG: M20 family metallopeptidase [Anaerolineales bacterium]
MQPLSGDEQRVVDLIDQDFARDLEIAAVRIPSASFQEREVAQVFADHMEQIGLEVKRLEVRHPFRQGVATSQPVGVLRGTSAGPSLMLNAHMDHMPVLGKWADDPFSGEYRDGWILGRGAQDDKGGVVSAITAAKALKESGVRFSGEIWVCPVAGHKSGCLGTKSLIEEGWTPDYCINAENTAGGIAPIAVGFVMCEVVVRGRPAHFASSAEAKGRHSNAIDQIARIAVSLGDSLAYVGPRSWLTFEPHAGLPGYPAISLDKIQSSRHFPMVLEPDLEYFTARLSFQIRSVPGQTLQSIQKDLVAHLQDVRTDYPALDVVAVNIPGEDPNYRGWDIPPFETPSDSPLLMALTGAYRSVLGSEPVVGAAPRLGAVGDGNVLAARGAEVVQYGPGDYRLFDSEPVVEERIALHEITDCARVFAVTCLRLLSEPEELRPKAA